MCVALLWPPAPQRGPQKNTKNGFCRGVESARWHVCDFVAGCHTLCQSVRLCGYPHGPLPNSVSIRTEFLFLVTRNFSCKSRRDSNGVEAPPLSPPSRLQHKRFQACYQMSAVIPFPRAALMPSPSPLSALSCARRRRRRRRMSARNGQESS